MMEAQQERLAAAESAASGASATSASDGQGGGSRVGALGDPVGATRAPAETPDAGEKAGILTPTHQTANPLPLVLHLVTDLRLGGTQAILLDRVGRAGPFRHAVLCFSARTGGNGAGDEANLAAAFGDLGVPVHDLGFAVPAEVVLAALTGRLSRRVDRVLTLTQPALLHSTLFHVHLLGDWMARRAGVPHLASKEGIDDWMGPLARRLESRALRRATRVAAVSQAAARVVRRLGVEASRIVVVPNGIDPTRPGGWVVPAPTAADGGAFAVVSPNGAATPAAGPRLLGVGRLDPVKGWDDLLDAMAVLLDSHPGIHLDLLGSGTKAERDRLCERAASRGLNRSVCIYAEKRNLLEPSGEAESVLGNGTGRPTHPGEPDPARPPILVVPSREEGFGLVLLEGMARGLPIVATRAGGIPEVARHDVEAILVPPRDPPALAEAIARLHADPALAARLAQGGRARIAAFPAVAMVDAYHRLYAEMLGSAGARRSPAR